MAWQESENMATEQVKRKQDEANSAYLKMRSEHRAKLVSKEIEIEDDAYAHKASGTLDGSKLKEGLKVAIPGWDNKPPPGKPEYVRLMIKIGSGNFVQVGDTMEFTIPPGGSDFPEKFPFDVIIGVNDLPDDAECQLRYIHRNYTGEETDSPPITFICDRLPPYKHAPPKEPVFAADFLDDTTLPAGSKLRVTIPGYPDWKSTDTVAFFLIDSNNVPEDPTDPITTPPILFTPVPAPGITDTVVELDGDRIRAFGDAKGYLTYALIDRALNKSPAAFPKHVSLTFGPLPSGLKKPRVPQATPGPLTVAHVQDGVSVWIDKYDHFKGRDAIRLKWGGQTLADFPIGNNSLPTIEIPVLPALLMLEDYGQATTGTKATVISYEVIRNGRVFGPESESFNVNFQVALPWLPWPPVDWPNPVHPDLDAGEVKNFDDTRTNELTRADKDKDATFHFTWYGAAVNGHVIDFYWNGKRVVEAQVTFDTTETGHVPGGDFDVEIPWSYIKDGRNGDAVPVHYQVSGPGIVNQLHSDTTDVVVNAIAVELPTGSFPSFAQQPEPDYPGCGSLENNGDLRVAIPDLTGVLEPGDKIEVVFTPMRGDDPAAPDNPITPAIFTKEFTLGDAASPVSGFEFLVTPYTTHILPLYTENAASQRRGRVKIQYFFDDGTETIGSVAKPERTAFLRPSDPCEIPKPPKP